MDSITAFGKKFTSLEEVADDFGMSLATLQKRLSAAFDIEAALIIPDDMLCDRIKLDCLTIHGVAKYNWESLSVFDLLMIFRPDLLQAYLKSNPNLSHNAYTQKREKEYVPDDELLLD